jgi:hypothetical protein
MNQPRHTQPSIISYTCQPNGYYDIEAINPQIFTDRLKNEGLALYAFAVFPITVAG